ncbi:hypothetical protein [Limnoglobus roseus]|uniref:hypothetical protein n=1 Tax=Limnoglobus roseus TaxID=2598579 RepID=UPI0011EAF1E3|nr:hypothetical protein [Limnoglobus roseus]
MRPELPPHQLTPDERFRELAAILAVGLLRLRDRHALATPAEPPHWPEEVENPLDLPPETSVTGRAG